MRLIECKQCGGSDFIRQNGYMICRYCNAQYAIEKEDFGIRESSISLGNDIDSLLMKCKTDPRNAKRYANLVLDIDPNNKEAMKYI